MTAILHLDVTPHAIKRYRQRFDGSLSWEGAAEEIRTLFRGARRLHSQGSDRAMYENTEREVRLVVRHPGTRNAAVLTVLFTSVDDDVDEMREVYAALPPLPPKPTVSAPPVTAAPAPVVVTQRSPAPEKPSKPEREFDTLVQELNELRILRSKTRVTLAEAYMAGSQHTINDTKRLVGIIRSIVNGDEAVFQAAKRVFWNAKSGIDPVLDENGNLVHTEAEWKP